MPYRRSIGNLYTPLLKGIGLIKQEPDGYHYAAGQEMEYTFDKKAGFWQGKTGMEIQTALYTTAAGSSVKQEAQTEAFCIIGTTKRGTSIMSATTPEERYACATATVYYSSISIRQGRRTPISTMKTCVLRA